jgi:methyltransferase family protein
MYAKIRKLLKAMTPRFMVRFFHSRTGRRLRFLGGAHRCPICCSHLRCFIDYGWIHKLKAEECPVCGSHRRHRLIWLYFHTKFDLRKQPTISMLHLAPEPELTALFRSYPQIDYLSADIQSGRAMVKMDITAIDYPKDSFDAIYCSHVLEHIPDDRKAMAELLRVLKPGGWAILQVPIDSERETTFEDPTIAKPEDRERAFWQFDHVRLYGRDYQKRLEEAGFEVTVDWYVRDLSHRQVRRMGLDELEGIYVCTKPRIASARETVDGAGHSHPTTWGQSGMPKSCA